MWERSWGLSCSQENVGMEPYRLGEIPAIFCPTMWIALHYKDVSSKLAALPRRFFKLNFAIFHLQIVWINPRNMHAWVESTFIGSLQIGTADNKSILLHIQTDLKDLKGMYWELLITKSFLWALAKLQCGQPSTRLRCKLHSSGLQLENSQRMSWFECLRIFAGSSCTCLSGVPTVSSDQSHEVCVCASSRYFQIVPISIPWCDSEEARAAWLTAMS